MDMQALVSDWTQREIPVLASTASALKALRRQEERTTGREISRAVLRDPLMTLCTLRYAETRRSPRQPTDITTVEHTLMMHGVSRFFRDFANLPTLELSFGAQPEALEGALTVVSRAQHAAAYARAIASRRADLETDEVIIGALLHELADLLLWCHQPREAALIRYLVEHAPGARSASLQNIVLGFSHVDLTLALADAWNLPPLLRRLMDDHHAGSARVANVVTAAALARHTAHGWQDPAIPDDLDAVRGLTGLSPDASYRLVRNAALEAARHWASVGIRPGAASLPSTADPAVGAPVPDSNPRMDAAQFQESLRLLKEAPASADVSALAAMTLHALHRGLGLERAAWAEVEPDGNRLTVRFALGDSDPPLRGYGAALSAQHLFGRLLQKPQGLLAGAVQRPQIAPLLDDEGRLRIGNSDFLAMSIYAADQPRGLFIADLGRTGRPIPESLYAPFKAACLAFAQRLDTACKAWAPTRERDSSP